MKYYDEILRAMTLLENHPKTIFIGQSVLFSGTGLYDSLMHVDENKRVELPVAEYLQCGLANGMALAGMIPVSIFPRWNFLLMGTDQIVNHLDKFNSMSDGQIKSKVIVRVSVGSENPVDPQCQHKGNFADAFKSMLQNINVVVLEEANQIVPAYEYALNREDNVSTILVEFADYCKFK